MQRNFKVLITAGILIGILTHLSEQSYIWDMLSRGRTLFAEGRNPSSSNRIMSSNMPETEEHDDINYEKATHRGSDSSERFGANIYEGKRQQEFAQYSPQRPSAAASHPYKENDNEYYGKYSYSQTKYPSSLNFYSFLGGLSFASLLATTFIVLSRRNGSLFRTFEDDDVYRSRKPNFEWDDVIPKTFLKLIDHPNYLWLEKEKHTAKKST